MANVRKKIIEFPNQIPTAGSAFLYAKKNPNNTYTTSNVTLDQLITLLNDELTFPPSGGSVLYSTVYFVDATNGNDLTAIPGDMAKPYATIYGAMDAADTSGLYSAFNRALVYVRPGSYGGILSLHSYIDVYCDPNVNLFGDFRDNAIATDVRIYGHAKFRGGRAFLLTGNSNVYCEFDNGEVADAFIIAVATVESFITLRGNYIKADGIGTAYGNSIRGNVNLDIQLKEHGTSIQTFMDIRNGYSGKMRIKTPEIHLATGNPTGADFKQCVFVRDCNGADIKIEAKLINDQTGYTDIYGLFTAVNVTNSKLELIGDIEGLDARAINLSFDNLSKFKYSGTITTEHEIFNSTGSGKAIFNNCFINKEANNTNDLFLLYDTSSLQCNNVFIIYESSVSVFNSLSDTTPCILLDTYVYNIPNSGIFAKGTTSWNIFMNNCVSNVNKDASVTDTATPTGFKNDIAFQLL